VLRRALGSLVEAVCLVLMVLLCVDVFLGVFSRYVLVQTFTWYDEIARGSFTWLVFLGAAVGVKQHAHFRLHLLVAKLSPRAQQAAEVFGFLMVIVLGLVLIQQGWALTELGRFQQTPVMGLSKFWIYLAIPVGGALMLLYSLPPLVRSLRVAARWSPSPP
jgi:TRAP-type C4-dicarboxylate transport system permease small subunit